MVVAAGLRTNVTNIVTGTYSVNVAANNVDTHGNCTTWPLMTLTLVAWTSHGDNATTNDDDAIMMINNDNRITIGVIVAAIFGMDGKAVIQTCIHD